MQYFKYYTQGVILAILSIFVFILVCEGFFRIYELYDPKVTKIDEALGWRHKPNSYKDVFFEDKGFLINYNEKGLRGTFKNYKKTAKKYRVLFLGDSFTDGSTIPDGKIFTNILESINNRIETVNMGVYAYGTVQEYLTYKQEGFKYNPDLVILMTYENDFFENTTPVYPPISIRPTAKTYKNGIQLVSIEENLRNQEVSKLFRKLFMPIPVFQYFLHKHSFFYYVLNEYVYRKVRGKTIYKSYNKSIQKYEAKYKNEVYLGMVRKIFKEVTRNKSDFAAFLISSEDTVKNNMASPNRVICKRLQDMGIPCVDMFSFLRTKVRNEQMYHIGDIHWNINGNLNVASFIENYIKSSKSFNLFLKRSVYK